MPTGQCKTSLKKKIAEDRLRQQNQYLSNLQQITLDLLNRKDTQNLLNNIARHAASLVKAQHGFIFLPEGNDLVLQAATEKFSQNIGKREPQPGKGVLGEVWKSGEILIVDNYQKWEIRDKGYKDERLSSIAGIPIKTNERIMGVLEVANPIISAGFSEENIQSLNHFASLIALVLQNSQLLDSNEYEISERKQSENILKRQMIEIKKLQKELSEQALRDHLTNLFNWRYLSETLEHEINRARRNQKSVSVIIMDIDHFKDINDTYVHHIGDMVLKEIAQTVKNFARRTDICCRFGGEEFLLVMPESNATSATKRAEELRRICAAQQIMHEGVLNRVTLSFGVAGYPEHCSSSAEFLIKADKALYHSKQQGRNRVTVWSEEPIS